MKKFTYGETVHICAEKAKEFKKEFWKDMFEYGVDTDKLESITQSLKTLCDNYMHAEAFDVVVSFNWFTSDVVDDFEYFCTDNALKSIFMEIILEEVEDIIEELIMEEYDSSEEEDMCSVCSCKKDDAV